MDFALVPDQVIGDGVLRQPLFSSAWSLWCSADHPLAKCRVGSWPELRLQPLVLAGYHHERSNALAHAAADSVTPGRIEIVDVVRNISTPFGMAGAGLAAAIAPTYTGSLARAFGVAMCPIVVPQVMHQVFLFYSAIRVMSPAAEGFQEFLTAWFGGRDDPDAWDRLGSRLRRSGLLNRA